MPSSERERRLCSVEGGCKKFCAGASVCNRFFVLCMTFQASLTHACYRVRRANETHFLSKFTHIRPNVNAGGAPRLRLVVELIITLVYSTYTRNRVGQQVGLLSLRAQGGVSNPGWQFFFCEPFSLIICSRHVFFTSTKNKSKYDDG